MITENGLTYKNHFGRRKCPTCKTEMDLDEEYYFDNEVEYVLVCIRVGCPNNVRYKFKESLSNLS